MLCKLLVEPFTHGEELSSPRRGLAHEPVLVREHRLADRDPGEQRVRRCQVAVCGPRSHSAPALPAASGLSPRSGRPLRPFRQADAAEALTPPLRPVFWVAARERRKIVTLWRSTRSSTGKPGPSQRMQPRNRRRAVSRPSCATSPIGRISSTSSRSSSSSRRGTSLRRCGEVERDPARSPPETTQRRESPHVPVAKTAGSSRVAQATCARSRLARYFFLGWPYRTSSVRG